MIIPSSWIGGAALLAATALATGAAASTPAARPATPPGLQFTVHSTGIEFVTPGGPTTTFPGTLAPGDRIIARDELVAHGRRIGYDNEVCTATFDANDLCQAFVVLPGAGQLQASWLWLGRNASQYGPARFSGVIDGGTGRYRGAHGAFAASVGPHGTLTITATLS